MRAEGTGRATQQLARACMLAELRHRDAAQRERRRVVAQRDVLERAERVAGAQRARGRGDQGVHRSFGTAACITTGGIIGGPRLCTLRMNGTLASRR